MRKLNLSKKSYFIAFVAVMFVNFGLAIFLINSVMAQTSSETSFKDQKTINVEIKQQKDCPILITVINVDNSQELHQIINYSIQNTSDKSIKGYVLLSGSKGRYKSLTNYFPYKKFQPNTFLDGEFGEERANIKNETELFLSVDYVEFEDGSSWGEDANKQSNQIKGGLTGAKIAIQQLKILIEKNDKESLSKLFEKNLSEVEVLIPDSYKEKDEYWQRGFKNGYKSIISFLKTQIAKGNDNLLEKLDELNSEFLSERRQK